MSSLAELRERVEQLLQDVSNEHFPTALLDECLHQALDEYSQVSPLTVETVLTLSAAGREIALESLPNLCEVLEVWWPYQSDGATFPPNRVRGWRLWRDEGQAVLYLESREGSEPQAGDQLRLWFAQPHTIQDLDGAPVTSLPGEHESALVLGAAAHAALSRAVDLIEIAGTDLYAIGLLGTWGRAKERQWQEFLESLRRKNARRGAAWGEPWRLDAWDR